MQIEFCDGEFEGSIIDMSDAEYAAWKSGQQQPLLPKMMGEDYNKFFRTEDPSFDEERQAREELEKEEFRQEEIQAIYERDDRMGAI